MPPPELLELPPEELLEEPPPEEPLEPDEPDDPPDEPPDELGEDGMEEDDCWLAQPPIRKAETEPIATQ